MIKFGIGQAVRRVEDHRFTTGAGEFVSDLTLPRQCYGVALLSPHAHAIIKRIDTKAAKAAAGVLCVLTGADADADNIGGIPPFLCLKTGAAPKASARCVQFCPWTGSAASAIALPLSLPRPKPKLVTRLN